MTDPASPPGLGRLRGRTVVVTGANAGLGLAATRALATAGARVVLACRDEGRAARAVAAIRAQVPAARLDVVRLDVADLASVADAARQLRQSLDGVDAVLCNAGVTGSDGRQVTADGFELMMGGNHLGHVALLARLLPLLRPGARVVTVGSIAHRWSPLDLDDLQAEDGFRSFRQYGRSKTAVTTFALELDRRARASEADLLGLTAHPGFALDALSVPRPGVPARPAPVRALARLARPVCHGKDAGAAPLVAAAAGDGVRGGQCWGPGGWQELTGAPALVRPRRHVRDPATADALWSESLRLVGLSLPLG